MRRLALTLVATAATALALQACGPLSPLELQPPGGCTSDTQCKGDRICVNGTCAWPDQVDGGPNVNDGGPNQSDGGPNVTDGGPNVNDGGPNLTDGGPNLTDGGPGDAGPPPFDGGSPDGGSPDGGGSADGGSGGPAPGAVGASCQATSDCTDPGAACLTQFPGGYCLVPGCGNGTCPQGSACVSGQGNRFCLQACQVDADCRPGYTCSGFAGTPVCLPAQGGGSTAVGGPCTAPDQCAGTPALCLTQWPGGYCATYNCDQHPCASGSSCIPVNGQHVCFQDCNASGDCGRPDYVCQPLGPNQGGACVPRCDQAQVCGQGQTCDPNTGLCH